MKIRRSFWSRSIILLTQSILKSSQIIRFCGFWWFLFKIFGQRKNSKKIFLEKKFKTPKTKAYFNFKKLVQSLVSISSVEKGIVSTIKASDNDIKLGAILLEVINLTKLWFTVTLFFLSEQNSNYCNKMEYDETHSSLELSS